MKLRKTPVQGQGFVRPENQNLQNFGEIIPVISGVIGGRETNIVSARALHKALGVGRVFRSWIKGRIEEYGFTEGVDYEVVEYLSRPDPVSAKSRQQTALEYIITVNMAKELAMVERTEQGRAVRQYFIKCEEELHKVAPVRSAALRRELKARNHYASRISNLAGYLVSGKREDGKPEYHIIPSVFDSEILCGISRNFGCQALEEAGMLVCAEPGRWTSKTVKINGTQRFIVLIDQAEDE